MFPSWGDGTRLEDGDRRHAGCVRHLSAGVPGEYSESAALSGGLGLWRSPAPGLRPPDLQTARRSPGDRCVEGSDSSPGSGSPAPLIPLIRSGPPEAMLCSSHPAGKASPVGNETGASGTQGRLCSRSANTNNGRRQCGRLLKGLSVSRRHGGSAGCVRAGRESRLKCRSSTPGDPRRCDSSFPGWKNVSPSGPTDGTMGGSGARASFTEREADP
ncbi:hypothetical protein EYF80_039966 [Liparis tanakae]|uniref:Uncharacterized protein n=1 Tax=Liparis tanakae TaxID=230148 RepID=A0A4Z2GB10_9TELE|nr:hypothetical protein EYF80_039966 [Liparis tanakae]